MADVRHTLGIDIGATKIAAAIVDTTSGSVLTTETIPTPADGGRSVADACASLANRLTAGFEVQGIGVGICEVVGRDEEIRSAATIIVTRVELVDALGRFGHVTIQSDVRAGAVAEAKHGAGRGLDCFLFVNAGSGISSCLMLGEAPYLGANGAAILLGAAPLNAESRAGGVGIARAYGTDSAAAVDEAAASGDTRALVLLKEGGAALGEAVGFAVNLLDPQAIVVGGGLALHSNVYWTSFESRLRATISPSPARDVQIERAELGDHAAVVGAALAAISLPLTGVSG